MINFDHFIYGVPKLSEATEYFFRQTGVRPQLGGEHPNLGTHNALASLDDFYFELLSVDPKRDPKVEIGIEALKNLIAPRLISWALQSSNFDYVKKSLNSYNMDLSPIDSGSRKTPDGRILTYEFATILGVAGPTELIPFFVRWINTIHPSRTSPQGCHLEKFVLTKKLSKDFIAWSKSESLVIDFEENVSEMEVTIKTPKGDLVVY